MTWTVAAGLSRMPLAVGDGLLLANGLGWGLEGQLLAVALGITAYGLLTAIAVRPGVSPGRSSAGQKAQSGREDENGR